MSEVRTHLRLVTLALALALLPAVSLSFAQPISRAAFASIDFPSHEVLHVTLKTQEGLERFVFIPRETTDTVPEETSYSGFSRPRNFQREKLPAALTITGRRAWLFYTSRRTGRPAAATISISASDRSLRAKRTRISRVPKQKIACGSDVGDDHTPVSTGQSQSTRRRNISARAPITAFGVKPFSPPRVLEVATDADFEFYAIHGEDTNAYIRAVLNAVDVIYAETFGVRLKVTTQRLTRKNPGRRRSVQALDLLESFRASPYATSSPADVRHLFTGKEIEGLTIGIAYVGAVCTAEGRYGVGLSNAVSTGLQPFLAAHEIGHNLSATHDSQPRSIMNPAITEANNRFTQRAISDVHSFVATVGSCLSTEQLSGVKVVLDSTDPTKFAARVGFNTVKALSCDVTLYGSHDGRRYLALASDSLRSAGGGAVTSTNFSSEAPSLTGEQVFYFKAKVSCEDSRTVSAPAKLRYGLATSGVSKPRNSILWLEALKRSLNGQ